MVFTEYQAHEQPCPSWCLGEYGHVQPVVEHVKEETVIPENGDKAVAHVKCPNCGIPWVAVVRRVEVES